MKVLDASGVINLRQGDLEGDFITVIEIKDEIKDIQARAKFEAAVGDGKIRIVEPSMKSLEHVSDIAEKNGISPLLSLPDLKIIALSYEKGRPIVTDDYDIQNMCWIMGLSFETIALPGIKGPFTWSKKCTACGKEYKQDVSECEACGSTHFKVLRKS